MDIPETDLAAGLTRQMHAFMERVQESRPDPWFHRKSEKLILSVVQVNVDGVPHFFEGMNAEVSLPTGSICAERSAILHARAKLPGVRRCDFMGVAVLEVPLVPEPSEPLANPLQPCGACREWLLKLQEENPSLIIVTYHGTDLAELEERFPDGRQGIADMDQSVAMQDEKVGTPQLEMAVEAEAVVDVASAELEKTLRRRHRTPWFPIWWLDDLVVEGLLLQRDKGGKASYEIASLIGNQ